MSERQPDVCTPIGRALYPNLLEARENKLNGKVEYDTIILFNKGQDLSVLEKAIDAARKAKWPKAEPPGYKNPIKDQKDLARMTDDGDVVQPPGTEPGAKFIRAASKFGPDVIDGSKSPVTDEKDIYSGCYIRAMVNPFPYAHESGTKGVKLCLGNVQVIAKGERIGGGRPDASTQFDTVTDEQAAEISAGEHFAS